jgi:hypothetical protein
MFLVGSMICMPLSLSEMQYEYPPEIKNFCVNTHWGMQEECEPITHSDNFKKHSYSNISSDYKNQETAYYFILKNGIKHKLQL